jgi:hypothetical protein
MRIIVYILIAIGVLSFASAGYDEFRGRTRSPSSRYTGYSSHTITRQADPDQFRNAMNYHWFFAGMLTIAGVIALAIDRGGDKCDPMSEDSDEKIDEELRQDELEGRNKPKPDKPPEP